MEHSNHFDTIAEVFNRIWYFSDEYKNFVITHIINNLALTHRDILADIGGGTGSFTTRLKNEAKVQKAYCIEPSSAMCDEASKLANITAISTDAHGFLVQKISFSKVLLKEVIHHITQRERFWHNTYEALPQGENCLLSPVPDKSLSLFSMRQK